MESVAIGALTDLEEVWFTRRDQIPLEVEVLRLEDLLRPPFNDKTTQPTRSHFHSLLFIDGAASSHHLDFERRTVVAGDLLVIPEGCVQAFDRARTIRGDMVLFTVRFLERCGVTVNRLAETGSILLRGGMHVRLESASLARARCVLAALADRTRSEPSERFAGEAIASAFSLLLFTLTDLPEVTEALSARTPRDELAARFLELIELRFRRSHCASDYARALHVSQRTLDRHVMAACGETARQAIAARLVLEAKRQLTRREIAVKNIAIELGFSEPQNFTRFFRARTGLSPTAFRAALQR